MIDCTKHQLISWEAGITNEHPKPANRYILIAFATLHHKQRFLGPAPAAVVIMKKQDSALTDSLSWPPSIATGATLSTITKTARRAIYLETESVTVLSGRRGTRKAAYEMPTMAR